MRRHPKHICRRVLRLLCAQASLERPKERRHRHKWCRGRHFPGSRMSSMGARATHLGAASPRYVPALLRNAESSMVIAHGCESRCAWGRGKSGSGGASCANGRLKTPPHSDVPSAPTTLFGNTGKQFLGRSTCRGVGIARKRGQGNAEGSHGESWAPYVIVVR